MIKIDNETKEIFGKIISKAEHAIKACYVCAALTVLFFLLQMKYGVFFYGGCSILCFAANKYYTKKAKSVIESRIDAIMAMNKNKEH